MSSAVLHHLATNDIVLSQCFPAMSYVSVVGRACMALTMLQVYLTWFTWWFCHTNMPQTHLHDHVAWPPAEFCHRLAETNPIISVSAVTY